MTPQHNKASTRSKYFKTKKKEAENIKKSLTETQINSLANAFNSPDSEELLKEFSDSEKTAFLKYIIKKYAALDEQGNIDKDMFNKTELSEATRLKLIEPEANPQSGNLFDMAADVISSIPKGLVLGLMVSEALKSVGAFPTEYNPNHQSAEPSENSDVVHHRSARDAHYKVINQNATLPNQHCFVLEMEQDLYNDWLMSSSTTTLYAYCQDKPCDQKGNIVGNKRRIDSSDSASELAPGAWVGKKSIGPDNETVITEYSFDGPKENPMAGFVTIEHKCHEPAYSLVKEADLLLAKKEPLAALEKYQDALDLREDYSLALEGKAKVLAELTKTTTAEPTSSTSNEASSTTTTTEAVTIVKNTTQAESSTTPQDQTTPSAEGWTVKNTVEAVVSVVAAFVVGGILYKKGSAMYNACLECWSKSGKELHPELKDCNGHGSFESDQFISSNYNGDAKVIQDSSVSLAGAEDLVTSEV
ncbi:MAG: hypothetical protein LN561_06530 [Rickettsia endosymbiont of Labidopullus appendiculatus]|nr:hypothetical protein [Rickettsia endosymbiont of Labidopullus appendiculatus]